MANELSNVIMRFGDLPITGFVEEKPMHPTEAEFVNGPLHGVRFERAPDVFFCSPVHHWTDGVQHTYELTWWRRKDGKEIALYLWRGRALARGAGET